MLFWGERDLDLAAELRAFSGDATRFAGDEWWLSSQVWSLKVEVGTTLIGSSLIAAGLQPVLLMEENRLLFIVWLLMYGLSALLTESGE